MRKVASVLVDKAFRLRARANADLVSLLRQEVRDIPPALHDRTNVNDSWQQNIDELKNHIQNDDVGRFLRWNVVQRTMVVLNPPYVAAELGALRASDLWESRWMPAIQEDACGAPVPYLSYPKSSGNLIHNAFHVQQFEKHTGTSVDELQTVIEFGGGYGSMCRLFHRLGFRGTYIIYDLPAFSALQRYFLRSTGVLDTHDQACSVHCLSDLTRLNDVMAERSGRKNSLFLATWSLSEAPLDVRASFEPHIRECDHHLIAYQRVFSGIDNVAYFDALPTAMGTLDWQTTPISHFPNREHFYSWGSPQAPSARPG